MLTAFQRQVLGFDRVDTRAAIDPEATQQDEPQSEAPNSVPSNQTEVLEIVRDEETPVSLRADLDD